MHGCSTTLLKQAFKQAYKIYTHPTHSSPVLLCCCSLQGSIIRGATVQGQPQQKGLVLTLPACAAPSAAPAPSAAAGGAGSSRKRAREREDEAGPDNAATAHDVEQQPACKAARTAQPAPAQQQLPSDADLAACSSSSVIATAQAACQGFCLLVDWASGLHGEQRPPWLQQLQQLKQQVRRSSAVRCAASAALQRAWVFWVFLSGTQH